MQDLKTKLEHVRAMWIEELPCVLWSFWTTPHVTTSEMPFSMVYGAETVLPIEIGVVIARIQAYAPTGNEVAWMEELDLVEKRHAHAVYRMEQYRSQIR